MTPREYASPAAFKAALEQRLRNTSESGRDLGRRRQLVVFDRFLARVTALMNELVTLKGGLVLELRLARARTTKDIDLRMVGSAETVLAQLREAGRVDLGDYMRFEIRPDPRHPELTNEGMQYEGYRFRVECRLAGKIYGSSFGVDVAFGDPIVGEPDQITADDVLGFAGIEPPTLKLYPVVSHVAEKLHAYTMPRPHPNSRVKDLPDLALLACVGPLDAADLLEALTQTFAFRKTHDLPDRLPGPPSAWERPYAALAEEDELHWRTLRDVHAAAAEFLDPVLGELATGEWAPATWSWRRAPS